MLNGIGGCMNGDRNRKGTFGPKRFLMVAMSVMCLLSFVGVAAAEDGYTNTVTSLKKIIGEAQERESYVRYFCDANAIGKPENNKNARGFSESNSVFEQNVRSDISNLFAKRNPGSQFNCITGSGTWVISKATWFFNGGRAFKSTYLGEWGLTDEYDFPTDGNNMVVRITDPQGNYIAILADLNNPSNSKYVETRLPINIQSSGIVTGDKGYQYSSDELVMAMNAIYKQLLHLPNSSLVAYANALLVKRQERDALIIEAQKYIRSRGNLTIGESEDDA